MTEIETFWRIKSSTPQARCSRSVSPFAFNVTYSILALHIRPVLSNNNDIKSSSYRVGLGCCGPTPPSNYAHSERLQVLVGFTHIINVHVQDFMFDLRH